MRVFNVIMDVVSESMEVVWAVLFGAFFLRLLYLFLFT